MSLFDFLPGSGGSLPSAPLAMADLPVIVGVVDVSLRFETRYKDFGSIKVGACN
jgi:hypothetical protein